jgi:hypothetical protein
MTELEGVRSELGALRRLAKGRRRGRDGRFDFKEAARRLGVAPKIVSLMVARGELMPIRLRGKWLIPIQEIERERAGR